MSRRRDFCGTMSSSSIGLVSRARAVTFAMLCFGVSGWPSALSSQPRLVPPAVVYSAASTPSGPDEPQFLPTREEVPLLILMPFTGAFGAQVLGSPEGWDRTWDGFGNRLGDQVGFLLIEEGVRRTLTLVLPPMAPRASCWSDDRSAAANLTAGYGCALWSTVAARPAEGDGWRFNAPVTVSLLAATGTSLAWRPERASAAKARSFLITRTAIVFGGMAAGRLFDDWRGGRSKNEG
jgi:hypothetical protein